MTCKQNNENRVSQKIFSVIIIFIFLHFSSGHKLKRAHATCHQKTIAIKSVDYINSIIRIAGVSWCLRCSISKLCKGSFHCFPPFFPSLYACLQLLKGQSKLVSKQSRWERSETPNNQICSRATLVDFTDAAWCHREILYALYIMLSHTALTYSTRCQRKQRFFFLCNRLATLTQFHLCVHPFSLFSPSPPILMIPYIDSKASPCPPTSRANFPLQPEVLSAAVCFVHRNSLRL